MRAVARADCPFDAAEAPIAVASTRCTRSQGLKHAALTSWQTTATRQGPRHLPRDGLAGVRIDHSDQARLSARPWRPDIRPSGSSLVSSASAISRSWCSCEGESASMTW
jgi:hypothetical protein